MIAMRKIIMIACFAVAFCGCKTIKNDTVSSVTPTEENGKTIKQKAYTLKKGESIELQMVTNASLGMHWEWVNQESVDCVKSDTIRYVNNAPKGMVGNAVDIYWKFDAIKKGTAVVRLEYGRFFPDAPREVAKITEVTFIVK